MARKYQVNESLVKAICDWESRSSWAGAVSHKGARGVCQIKPDTVKHFCPNCYATDEQIIAALDDPRKNIELAAAHIRWLTRVTGTDNDYVIMAAYFGGNGHEMVQYLAGAGAALKRYGQ